MVDSGKALREILLQNSTVTSLLQTDVNSNSAIYVGNDLPEHFDPANGPAILISHRGGHSHAEITALADTRVQIKVAAGVEKYLLAFQVYQALFAVLQGITQIGLDSGTTLINNIIETTAAQGMTDPDTGWCYVIGFWNVLATDVTAVGPAGGTYAPDSGVFATTSAVATAVAVETSRAELAESLLTPVINIKAYGAVGDANIVGDAGCFSGTNVITSASANFTPADVGKQFSLTPTEYDVTHQTVGTIIGYTNSTTVTVSINSLTTASNCRFTYGTDNTTAIQAAITAAQSLAKGILHGININNTSADIPAILFPPPSPGIGYIVSGALQITEDGVCFTTGSDGSMEGAQIILNAPGACVNYQAPSGTYHTFSCSGVCIEGNFVANYGIVLTSIEECEFKSFRINNCLVAGVSLVSSNLTRWNNIRGFGNATFFLLSNSNNNEFYGLNIFGYEHNPTPVTFNAFYLIGTGVQNVVHGGFFEQFTNIVVADNTSSACSYSGFAFRDCKVTGGVTECRLVSASSQSTSNLMFLNMLFDGVVVNLTANSYLCDLLMNAHAADSSVINLVFKNNVFLQVPSTAVFHTDDQRCRIAYTDNMLVGSTLIVSGAGLVAGADSCGSSGTIVGVTLHGPTTLIDSGIGSGPTTGLALQNNTLATGSQVQNPPTLELDGNYWTGSASAAISVKESLFGGATFSTLQFLFTGHLATVTPAVTLKNNTAATSGQNAPGPAFTMAGFCWSGTASIADSWQLLPVLGSGSEPSSTLAVCHFGSTGSAILDLTGTVSGTAILVKVPTKSALDNSTNAASTAYADAAVAVETSRAQTAEALKAPLASPALTGTPTAPTPGATDNSTKIATTAAIAAQLVDGTPAANCIGKVVATRILQGQASVDGSVSSASLFTVGVTGVYRITCGMTVRTKSSSAWVVLASISPPSGTNLLSITEAQLAMSTGGTTNGQQCTTLVLDAGDVVRCGTTTSSGSNTGGNFDVCWIVERLA